MTETRKIFAHSCLRCGTEWEGYREHPKTCRYCGSPLWNVARVRMAGGGAYKKALVLGVTARKIAELMARYEVKFPEEERAQALGYLKEEVSRLRGAKRVVKATGDLKDDSRRYEPVEEL